MVWQVGLADSCHYLQDELGDLEKALLSLWSEKKMHKDTKTYTTSNTLRNIKSQWEFGGSY